MTQILIKGPKFGSMGCLSSCSLHLLLSPVT